MIETRGLTKTFGSTVALDRVSFRVGRGEVVGFLGPNAAGKTTAMRILAGCLYPDRGTAVLSGFDVLADPREVQRRVGYLPENAPLYDTMEVGDFLEFSAGLRGLRGAARRRAAGRAGEVCALEEVQGRAIGTLSRGYRQRVALAQALVHSPEILILDEPTTGLDPHQIVEVRELIGRLKSERTVIFSTHILSEVEAVCGRVLIINRGRIVAEGTPSELRSRARGGLLIAFRLRAPEAQAREKLVGTTGVRRLIDLRADPDGYLTGRLEADPAVAVSEQIYRLAAEAGWGLSELRSEPARLEEVFISLTRDSGRGTEKSSE